MRYYRLEIFSATGAVTTATVGTDAAGNVFTTPTSASSTSTAPELVFTSYPNGQVDLNAADIEFDITVGLASVPVGVAMIKVKGVSLQQVAQASDFNNKTVKFFAGMSAGLPLANPNQAGLILEGKIISAFGNWIGNEQWIEFYVVAVEVPDSTNVNITLNWKKGQSLKEALTKTLGVAFPNYTPQINISSKVVLAQDEPGFFRSVSTFAYYLQTMSKAVIDNKDYQGIDILFTEKTVIVNDATVKSTPKDIDFRDLIGQPTWLSPGEIQVTTVLRADIHPYTFFTLPRTQITYSPSNVQVPADKSVFQGTFVVKQVRHLGSFRQADGMSWITTIDAAPDNYVEPS